MAQSKKQQRTFLGSRMDLDSDARIIKDGHYRAAQNIQVARTENADAGAAENVRGNSQIPGGLGKNKFYTTIGTVRDDLNDRIYWFFVGNVTEGIYELDISNDEDEYLIGEGGIDQNGENEDVVSNTLNPLYGFPKDKVSRIIEFDVSKKILNFNVNHLITGANVVGDLLYWTDGFNPPRKINIKRFRGSGNYYFPLKPTGWDEDENGTWDKDTIVDLEGYTFYEGDYDPEDNDAIKTFKEPDSTGEEIYGVAPRYSRLISDKNPAYDADGVPLVNFGDVPLTPDEERYVSNQPEFTGDIISVAKRPPLFPPKILTLSSTAGVDRDGNEETESELEQNKYQTSKPASGEFMFDNFVYFAYRYKYRDGEVTPLSPFSVPVFYPRQYNLQRDPSSFASMVNDIGKFKIEYDVGSHEVTEVELVVTSTANTNVYSLAIINKEDERAKALEADAESEAFKSSTPYKRRYEEYFFNEDKFYITLPSDQLTRTYDAVPITAEAQEIVGNRLVYGNYVQNYSLKRKNEDGEDIVVDFDVDYRAIVIPDELKDANYSVKSDRTYELAVVYMDAEGRQSPALVSDSNTKYIPFSAVKTRNLLNITMNSPAPYWATHYRFAIKQTKQNYYNIFPKEVLRDTTDQRIYLRLDSAEINKLNAESELILKHATKLGIPSKRKVFKVDVLSDEEDVRQNGDAYVSEDGTIKVSNEGITQFGVSLETVRKNTSSTEDWQYYTSYAVGDVVRWEGRYWKALVAGSGNYPIEQSGTNEGAHDTTNWEEVEDDGLIPNDSDAKGDFYVALSPIEDADLEDFEEATLDKDVVFETIPELDSKLDIYYEHGETFKCYNGAHSTIREELYTASGKWQSIDYNTGEATDSVTVELEDYFNTFMYSNGIEENRVLGKFNNPALPQGIKATTVNEAYRQRKEISKLIHSGIFNDDINLNRLNEFNPTHPSTAELDISEGSIQKLFARDTNLVVFQEDKVSVVPIQKNLIQTAGGTAALTADSRFFGTAQPMTGEYGISKNPESFCYYGHEMYWADKNRGVLLSFAGGQINEISKQGAEFYIRQKLKDAHIIIGMYDDYKDQAFFSFKNKLEQPVNSAVLDEIIIGVEGDPDPRAECNKDLDFINFKSFTVFYEEPDDGITLGDAIFSDHSVDEENEFLDTLVPKVPFTGNYRWHRVKEIEDGVEDTDSIIQIGPYGLVTGIENSCSTDFPADTPRKLFNVSHASFISQRAACANGRVDDFAYHDGDGDEPDPGDTIYEDRQDIIPSSRTGIYLITEGKEKWVINVVNGVVRSKIDCDVLSRDRTPALGSFPEGLNAGYNDAIRNLKLCSLPFAQSLWWFKGDGKYPDIGATIYDNDHDDEKIFPDWDSSVDYTIGFAVTHSDKLWRALSDNKNSTPSATNTDWKELKGNLYIQMQDGIFIRVNKDSEVLEVGSCSTRQCFPNPNDILTQDGRFNGTLSFEGLDGSKSNIENAEVEFYLEGPNIRIPATGTFKVNAVDPDDTSKLIYKKVIDDTENVKNVLGESVRPITFVPSTNSTDHKKLTLSFEGDNKEEFEKYETEYDDEVAANAEDIQFKVVSLCYRGLDTAAGLVPVWTWYRPVGSTWSSTVTYDAGEIVTHSSKLYKAEESSTNVDPSEGGTKWDELTEDTETKEAVACGAVVEDAIYYDPEDEQKKYYKDTDRTAFDYGAGLYAIAELDPESITEAEGGGVVTKLEYVESDGLVTFSKNVDCDYPYELEVGYTSFDDTANLQDACDVTSTIDVLGNATWVRVLGDEPLSNFSSADSNPVTGLRVINNLGEAVNAPDGNYSNGTVLRDLENGVLADNNDQGCQDSYTYTLSGSEAIDNATISYSQPQGKDVVEDGDVYSITATILPDNGYEWATGPWYAVDGGTTVQKDNYTFSGTAAAEDTDRDQAVVFTGTTKASETTTYNAYLGASKSSALGSSTFSFSVSGHSSYSTGSNSVSLTKIPNANTPCATVTISPPSGYYFTSISNNKGGGSSYTTCFKDNVNESNTVYFYGSIATNPTTCTASLGNTNVPANATATTDSATINTGTTTTLTNTISANSGWTLYNAPGGTSKSKTVGCSDGSVSWTGYTVRRHQLTLNVAYYRETLCAGNYGAATYWSNSSSWSTSNILYDGATSSTKLSQTLYILSGSTVYKWDGTDWSNDGVCTPTLSSHYLSYDSGSSQTACDGAQDDLVYFNGTFSSTGGMFSNSSGTSSVTSGWYSDGKIARKHTTSGGYGFFTGGTETCVEARPGRWFYQGAYTDSGPSLDNYTKTSILGTYEAPKGGATITGTLKANGVLANNSGDLKCTLTVDEKIRTASINAKGGGFNVYGGNFDDSFGSYGGAVGDVVVSVNESDTAVVRVYSGGVKNFSITCSGSMIGQTADDIHWSFVVTD